MKYICGVQARSGSKRFPDKIYSRIGEVSMLEHVWNAACRARDILDKDELIPVILIPTGDDKLAHFCKGKGFEYFEGFEEDLFERYKKAAESYKVDAVIRVTGDCPLIPFTMIVDCAKALLKVDYACNTIVRTYPEGWDVQGARIKAFNWFYREQKKEREHPFKDFDENKSVRDIFETGGMTWSNILDRNSPILMKLSIDTKEDLQFVQSIIIKSGKTEPSKS